MSLKVDIRGRDRLFGMEEFSLQMPIIRNYTIEPLVANLLRNEDMSAFVKTDLLEELEAERDRRLAIVPELRKKANVPLTQIGNF